MAFMARISSFAAHVRTSSSLLTRSFARRRSPQFPSDSIDGLRSSAGTCAPRISVVFHVSFGSSMPDAPVDGTSASSAPWVDCVESEFGRFLSRSSLRCSYREICDSGSISATSSHSFSLLGGNISEYTPYEVAPTTQAKATPAVAAYIFPFVV